MKVLIVEDDLLIGTYLQTLMAEFGHEVCATATSAGDAIRRAAASHPDVTLMDIRLSDGSSGIDAAREIHARYRLRCIFLSGNPDEATRAAVAACEPIDFLAKPVMPFVLQRALEKAENLEGVGNHQQRPSVTSIDLLANTRDLRLRPGGQKVR